MNPTPSDPPSSLHYGLSRCLQTWLTTFNLLCASFSFWKLAMADDDQLWPELALGWRCVVGSVVVFAGAALGSAGGVGGGSIFVPAAHLIIGFDTKSSTALSKCMIMGAAISTIAYNLGLKHPHRRDSPIIDYDIAMVLQPMLLLGISIGVIFNSIFPTWILTLLLISVMLGTGLRVFKKALNAWKEETLEKKLLKEQQYLQNLDVQGGSAGDYQPLSGNDGSTNNASMEIKKLIHNIKWKNIGALFLVWALFVVLQVVQGNWQTCTANYWILNSLQIPVAISAFVIAAKKLYEKSRRMGEDARSVMDRETSGGHGMPTAVGLGILAVAAGGSLIAGIIGGLLGLGGGFAVGPLLLELGAHPQVTTATATFTMFFSSSMSVLEYYLLNRFPVPYALYLFAVSMVGGLCGQYIIQSLVRLVGRSSIIIILVCVLTMLSAVILGGLGIQDAIKKLRMGEYLGFSSLC